MSIDDRGKRQLEFHVDRRGLLRRASAGFPLLSLYGSLSEEVRAAEVSRNPLSPRQPHHAPRAKSVIFLFMGGGPSQVDLFDPKPKLADHTKIPIKLPRITRDSTPNCRPSPFRFQQHGESGTWFSELMPNLSRHADDLCIVRSVYCDQIEHSGAIRQMTTGDGVLPRPSVGAWSLYGLGSENDSLPGFVSISRQSNLAGKVIHGSSFLPAAFEGTSIPDVKKPIANLAMPVAREIQATRLAAIRRLAEVYRRRREDDSRLDARLAAYELAFRMQSSIPEIEDLSGETAATMKLYGMDNKVTKNFGRMCLMARRFAEEGVRFIQVTHNDDKVQWDQHANLKRDHEKNAREVDLPIAGLLTDLKQRGMLEDTLIWWGSEFGRTPTAETGDGRDHNPEGFTMWLAGGGVKGGFRYGETDDYGYYAAVDKVHIHDFHATLLHALGLDHEQLTYRHAGRDFRLTDVEGNVVHDVFA